MKIIKVLRRMSKVERNRFRKFLESPYLNANRGLLDLFTIIDSHLRENQKLERNVFWRHIHGTKEYDDAQFRKLSSELINKAEIFLGLEKLFENPIDIHNASFSRILEMDSDELITNVSSKADKALNKSSLRSSDYYLAKYELLKNKQKITSDFEKKKESSKTTMELDGLQEMNRSLDVFYLAEKLKLACAVDNYKHIATTDIHIPFEEEVITMARRLTSPDLAALHLYLSSYELYANQHDEAYLDELISKLPEYFDQFEHEELKDIYEHWLNYCVRRANAGEELYFKKVHDIYSMALELGLIFENDVLSPTDYRNIVYASLRINELDWAMDFVEKYRQRLLPAFQESAYSFNKARILINMREFDKVVETLQHVEYEDLTYNLNSKLLLMVSYYELDEMNVLDSFIKSFRLFLRRRRNIPKGRRDAFYGFTTVLSHIIKASERLDAKKLGQAKEILGEKPAIPNRNWLSEKMIEIEKVLKPTKARASTK